MRRINSVACRAYYASVSVYLNHVFQAISSHRLSLAISVDWWIYVLFLALIMVNCNANVVSGLTITRQTYIIKGWKHSHIAASWSSHVRPRISKFQKPHMGWQNASGRFFSPYSTTYFWVNVHKSVRVEQLWTGPSFPFWRNYHAETHKNSRCKNLSFASFGETDHNWFCQVNSNAEPEQSPSTSVRTHCWGVRNAG